MTKKFWLFMEEHGFFTKKDHHICKVFFTGQDSGYEMRGTFIEADDLELARIALKAQVDKHIDGMLHAVEMEKFSQARKKKREDFMAKPAVDDSAIDSLSIGEFVGEKPKASPAQTDGLLDLETLL